MVKTAKVVLVFVGVFIAGGITGGLLSLRCAKQPAPKTIKGTVEMPSEQQWVIGQMRRFVRELQLDNAQRELVKPVVTRADNDFRRLRKRTYRETMEIIERMNNEIAPMLTDEQKGKFEDLRWGQRKRIEDLMMGTPKKTVPANSQQPQIEKNTINPPQSPPEPETASTPAPAVPETRP